MDFETLYREERPRALATLIRLLGSFDLAEEALHEAFTVALERWPGTGFPRNPTSWLISTARHKAIDRLRRERRLGEMLAAAPPDSQTVEPDLPEDIEPLEDDPLRLIFTCCHPASPPRHRSP
jgi:RNA polymerase sigma-70 factor (ECF subfamily)